ncbi:MAG: response regulator [Chitinophagales bacterium]|jgi:DNA-binding response OmpR family regulator|nr:response regulator [Chitinophagales bacterium]
MKVLIVDDEPDIIMTLDFLMRKAGFDVFIGRDGAEAIELVKEHQPDLVILDIMMPNVDGYEVCTFIKQTEEYKNSKVIFLSAKGKEVDIERGYAVGADFYMPKPFSSRELVKKAKELLAK